MNISFCKLGEEECEMCLVYEAHKHDEIEIHNDPTKEITISRNVIIKHISKNNACR